MKKIFTLVVAALIGGVIGADAQTESSTIVLCNPNGVKQNVLEGEALGASAGWKMQCMNEAKNLESGKAFNINGQEYNSIKFSNGAQNTVTLPEGYVATKVTFYSTINKDAATERTPYWAEVNGTTFTEDEANIMVSYKDYENPDINAYNLGEVSSFTFKNTGEQPFAVLVVEYKVSTAINNITTNAVDAAAPIYNLAGQQVSKDYKGVCIQNGRKFINK